MQVLTCDELLNDCVKVIDKQQEAIVAQQTVIDKQDEVIQAQDTHIDNVKSAQKTWTGIAIGEALLLLFMILL